jgi:DNA-binding transcriptional MerR regulator
MSSRDICRLLSITARQAQWWVERGLIRPLGLQPRRRRPENRHSYRFEADQVVKAAFIANLRRRGYSLAVIRKAKFKPNAGRFALVDAAGAVQWSDTAEDAIARAARTASALVCVDVGELRALVEGRFKERAAQCASSVQRMNTGITNTATIAGF